MPSLIDISWLIPALPLATSLLIGVLLISFNRTMNRLTKPVSFLVINSIILSTFLSLLLFLRHQYGTIFDFHAILMNKMLNITLYLDYPTEIFLVISGTVTLLALLISYFSKPRTIGYVRYVTLLTFSCGLLFFMSIASDFPKSLLQNFA